MNPSRRQMLTGAGAGLATAALSGGVLASPARAAIRGTIAGPAAGPQPGAREYDFGPDWRFALVTAEGVTDPTGAYTSAYTPGFDDSGWRVLDVPHDWSVELAPVDASYTANGNGFLPGGLGWYRKTFVLPAWMTGQRISVEFDGVYMNSNVYVNGQLLGNHPYAYTGFSYDLTGLVHTDGSTPNVMAVQASNQIPSSRWYSGSGIYRNVWIVVTEPVHIARHGTFITTPDAAVTVPDGYADVQVTTDIQNETPTAATVTVGLRARDARGVVVASGSATVDVAAGSTQTAGTVLRIPDPALWSVSDPVLYTLETHVSAGGPTTDSTTVPFGIRFFEFDPDTGFSLNGQHMKLHGVDLHATQGPLGAAVHADSVVRQLRLMKSYGVNAVRTAHNPPAPELVAAAQELGLLLMVEAFDCWHTGKLPYDYHLYFDQWGDRDIKEMVLAHRNSPAVILWSIGNETPDTGLPDGPPIATRLMADVQSIDTSRPVVMGSDQYRSVPRPGSPQDQIAATLDGLGVNYNTATSMDGLHATYGGKFFFCSETSSETSTRGFYQDPQLLNTGPNFTPGKCETSSYDNNLSSWCMSGEYELKKDRDRLFWTGGFLWAGQDYIGEPTPYAQFPVKASFFGAIDTAGFAKDARFLYASQWTTAPMVHIAPMDWTTWEAGSPVSVWVYANVASVELFLNGQSLGEKSFTTKVTTFGQPYLETTEPTGDDYNYPSGSYTSPNGSTGKLHLTWSVPFEPGTLVAVGYASSGSGRQEVARDEVVTAGPARALSLSLPDSSGTLAADGKSLAYVTASVVDTSGLVVPDASHDIRFSVTGAGVLKATDNGRQENARGYTSDTQSAFFGQALAVVGSLREPGQITLTAQADGLAPARLRLTAVPAPAVAIEGAAAGLPRGATPGREASAGTAPAAGPTADASFSGQPSTLPAMMLDGSLETYWSNYYVAAQTANILAVSVASLEDWVSLSWGSPRRIAGLTAAFVTGGTGGALALPAAVAVSYWNGHELVPARNTKVTWASGSSEPTSISFEPVTTTRIRLTMTSAAPGTSVGFVAISELTAVTG
ncbi:MAG TPA: glycoside hydrolase family 2 TIM barrel-domain containing protein [Trebonia sp.]|nr:glycoside hydrolase family 2 TIM barrel-domain containing protein [Trebonia sp.]